MPSLDDYLTTPKATNDRPLLGQTILVVEDSRHACEALRLMCLRSGARIRMADCLTSARRHLKVYRPSVIVIDIGLPDGSGADLLEDLANASPRVDVILGTSGDPNGQDMALAAGADGFLEKPLTSLAAFQDAVLSHLPDDRRPSGPRSVNDEIIVPDRIAYQNDMAHIADVLGAETDARVLDYITQFTGGVARTASDRELSIAVENVIDARTEGHHLPNAIAALSGLVQDRLNARAVI
ncbi:response regulator [Nereida ignava]|uniref:KDP operon transcriptional regulatory protein KdpE n=1 Tax=Nereida ignava TaxID=282199 RepID=A0A0U1NNI4_9RHOB|nr:response regulator [Nereida ignava]CRK76053.1 KDP operon transcriptional regulatory protein KdpE [Nereida ignava]SFJ65873.1 Response regulator receiver domain-containing protein [Nereida ignava DSM 16309]